MLYDRIKNRNPINKGWSGDRKYCALDEAGNKYLLRIADISQHERKLQEFEYMTKVDHLSLPICKPLEVGVCEDGVYSIQSWIEGKDMYDCMDGLSDTEVYNYGYMSGQILKKMHSIPAPNNREDWARYFNRKADRKIQMYNECTVKHEKAGVFIDYINEHRYLLENRPQTFHHGDFHIGNMMISDTGSLYIIDFNRFDFGDPWEEFNRIVWMAEASHHLARGVVDGYFENEVPDEFWKLMALYISSNTLGSLAWAERYGDEEIVTMRNQTNSILEWYDDMQLYVPKWYKE